MAFQRGPAQILRDPACICSLRSSCAPNDEPCAESPADSGVKGPVVSCRRGICPPIPLLATSCLGCTVPSMLSGACPQCVTLHPASQERTWGPAYPPQHLAVATQLPPQVPLPPTPVLTLSRARATGTSDKGLLPEGNSAGPTSGHSHSPPSLSGLCCLCPFGSEVPTCSPKAECGG